MLNKIIKEAYENIISEASPEKTDSHEIMTACLCTLPLSDINKYISQLTLEKIQIPKDKTSLSKDEKNKLKELKSKVKQKLNILTNKIFPDILADVSKIAKQENGKIVGAFTDEKESILKFKDRNLALLQALSAAKAILENNKDFNEPEHVILTGKKWDKRIAQFSGIENLLKFNVNSYGMKDFNSSDIVLLKEINGQEKFLGISLKKKKIGEKDPTIINRSLFDLFETYDEDVKKEKEETDLASTSTMREQIEKIFDTFFNEELSEIVRKKTTIKDENGNEITITGIDNLIGDKKLLPLLLNKKESFLKKASKKSNVKIPKYENYLTANDFGNEEDKTDDARILKLKQAFYDLCLKAPHNENKKIWKLILSPAVGLMATHDNRVFIRDKLNPLFNKPNSPFRVVEKKITDRKISPTIAMQLLEIIFKGQLMNLKGKRFSFALCTGIGKYNSSEISVDEADYEALENVTSAISKIKDENTVPLLRLTKTNIKTKATESNSNSNSNDYYFIITEDEDEELIGTITIFMDLMVKSENLALIQIRYKGTYTSGPEVLATIAESFKQKIKEPLLADNPDPNSQYPGL